MSRLQNIAKAKKKTYHVVWKAWLIWWLSVNPVVHFLSVNVLRKHWHSWQTSDQVVNTFNFGIPQRRRRLYILGSPRAGPPPVMRGRVGKKRKLDDFLSKRRKENKPGDLFAVTVSMPHIHIDCLPCWQPRRKNCEKKLESRLPSTSSEGNQPWRVQQCDRLWSREEVSSCHHRHRPDFDCKPVSIQSLLAYKCPCLNLTCMHVVNDNIVTMSMTPVMSWNL